MKDYSKSAKTGAASAVRQVKGPGMNKGLKKPRRAPTQPKDYGTPAKPKTGKGPAFTGSYLPPMPGLGRKKSKP